MKSLRVFQLPALVLLVMTFGATVNGGTPRWSRSGPEGALVTSLVFDPSNSSTLYAGTLGGIFRTTDGGATWQEQVASWPLIDGVPIEPSISSMAIDPLHPSTLYAGTSYGELMRSTDGAANWVLLTGPFQQEVGASGRVPVRSILVDPGNSSTIYLLVGADPFRSTDGGVSWSSVVNNLRTNSVQQLAIDPSQPSVLYAATSGGMFRTGDRGNSWSLISITDAGSVDRVVVDPKNSSNLYVLTEFSQGSPRLFVTRDAGRSWSLKASWSGQGSALAIDPSGRTLYVLAGELHKSVDAGQTWTTAAALPFSQTIVIDPANTDVVYAGSNEGVFRSANAAGSWAKIATGMTAAYTLKVAVDPTAESTAYAGTSGEMFKTVDGGKSWQLEPGSPVDAWAVEVDGQTPSRIFAGNSQNAKRSVDGGQTWTGIAPDAAGKNGTGASDFAIDPSNQNNVYAALADGLSRSADGGTSWTVINSGLQPGYYGGFYTSRVVVDPVTPSRLFATSSYLVRSTDGGNSWTPLTTGLPDLYSGQYGTNTALTIDPRDHSVIYTGGIQGMYRSNDGGDLWTRADAGIPNYYGSNPYIYDIVIDPATSAVYAAAYGAGVYRSADAGRTWTALNDGLTIHNVRSLAISRQGRFLYAATPGGVFTLDLGATLPPGVDLQRLPDDPTRLPRLMTQLKQEHSGSAPSPASQDFLVIAAAGSVRGGNDTYFQSDLSLVNWSSKSQDVFVAWLEQGKDGTNAPSFRLTLPAAAVDADGSLTTAPLTITNFVGALNLSGLGALLITATDANGNLDSLASIDAYSRIWTPQPRSAGTVSQALTAAHYADLMGDRRIALGMRHDGSFRTNAGVVNLDSQAADFFVKITGQRNSALLAAHVPAFSMVQLPMPDGDYGSAAVQFVSGRPALLWTAYGSSTDRTTGDGWISQAAPTPRAGGSK